MSSSDRQITKSDCIVIGGGITGLVIASLVQRHGIKVTVLDKGKDVGGRLATRRMSKGDSVEGIFDYGSQYFTVNNPQFQIWVNHWLKHNVVKKWFNSADGKPCYCGVDGTRGIAKYLAKNLDVHSQTKAIDVNYEKQWLIKTEGDREYQGDMLVMTPPIPQFLSLLDSSLIPLPLEIRFALEQIEYDNCIAVLALLEKPSIIPPPGGISLENNSLVWLGDNYQKGISPQGYGVTLHASSKFSNEYWNSDDAEIAYKLITAAADYLDSPVIKYQVHRWRYSVPKTFYSEPCLALLEFPLVMAGDAFVAPTIEGAVISGMAAGELVSQRFGVS
jgi:hypothetical protein